MVVMSNYSGENRIMRTLFLIASMCCLLAVWAGPAAAMVVIDFEDLPASPFPSYTEAGVTFTAVGGGQLQRFADMPNGTFGLTGLTSPYPELRADIAGGATFVSVELGDFAEIDAETVFLEAFDASGNSLRFVSYDIPADRMGMTALSVSAPGISYAICGARNSTLDNGSSVPADNFTFAPADSIATVPAPGAILLAMVGIGLASRLRRRGTL